MGGSLFEAGRLLTFPTYRVGAYSRLGAQSNKYGIGESKLFSQILIVVNLSSSQRTYIFQTSPEETPPA